ncbi:NIL domain-containing protein [Paludibacterium paludis]|uniref:NIL domain-containing protein n=1 Tax=Paludibacterium paludis TaxID=1225769 RepID=UPI003CC8132C
MSREHRVNFNLVNGTLADIKGTPFGQLLVGVVKSDIPLADLQTVFHEKGVDCEVLP